MMALIRPSWGYHHFSGKVQEQADEYGHSFERELAYLTIHGMLHILGYDHMEPDDKAEMRKEEEFILQRLGYVREGEEL